MSERSKRRAAEMAVLDAASHVYHYAKSGGDEPTTMGGLFHTLLQAVEDLETLGLEAPTGTPTNFPPEQTALDAAESMRKIAGKLAGKVLVEILTAHYEYGVTGLTTDAIQARLHGTHQGISPRITELRDKGWIVDSGIRRATRSGRKAIVWKPTRLALEASRLVKEWSW